VRTVARFAQHFRTSPDKLDFEHVRAYQLHLVHSGFQAGYIRQAMTVLRFFYKVTLGRPDAVKAVAQTISPRRARCWRTLRQRRRSSRAPRSLNQNRRNLRHARAAAAV
jgi:Phage integrase, N-terminal SAM-like domain